jgi:protein phosphatase
VNELFDPISIPELSLVVLIGPSGAGKSTFARQHFLPTEIVSSDACRAAVSDDENDLSATEDAFALLHYLVGLRLKRGKLTVVDATNVQVEARRALVRIARAHHVLPVAIVLNLPERLCHERNRERPDRQFGPHVVRRQVRQLRQGLRSPGLAREGFRYVSTLTSPEQVAAARIVRQRLWNDRRDDHGPFDVVGDVHGCFDELVELLTKLGYAVTPRDESYGAGWTVEPPAGRTLVFLGDLVDRGPRIPDVLRLAMGMVEAGTAYCIPGNHDDKLLRALKGRKVRVGEGLAESLRQLEAEPPAFKERVCRFLDGLISHYVLDGGDLVVAHAGLKEEMQGRASGAVRDFCLYGETTGEQDELGLPVRLDWARDYRGRAHVVYGHTPVGSPEWLNRTINVDTGCVFGGSLTALRWPERELVTVPARRVYAETPRRFLPSEVEGDGVGQALTAQQRHDELLDLTDVTGKRFVETRLISRVTIGAEQAAAALEVLARFAADPRWLIYLPPTMSAPETSARSDLLEHPAEVFAHYRSAGVDRVVCEAKHMGSRAVVVVCRDADAARRRFGVTDGSAGIVYTRTGRPFFADRTLIDGMLDRIRGAAERAGLWEELATDWLLLDAELLPWSAKADDLLRRQYASTGAAARAALGETMAALDRAVERGADVAILRAEAAGRLDLAERYTAAYRAYCWPIEGLADLRLAPFHLLASAGRVHADQTHRWHLDLLDRLDAADSGESLLLLPTDRRELDLSDPVAEEAVTAWWDDLTASGGEGIVVKPLEFVLRGPRGLVQPAIKCRGREYLRLIYGPEYSLPANLERLRNRGLARKRSLALREFAIGLEGLERFVAGEPLRRVHECALGVLALESEPVDPRL